MRRQKLETKQLYHPNYRDKNAVYMHKIYKKTLQKNVLETVRLTGALCIRQLEYFKSDRD